MNATRALSLIASLGLVVLVTAWESVERVAPGPLHPAHATLIETQGSAGCEACHGGGAGGGATTTDAAACGQCHAAIAAQREAGTGLHGALDAALAADCGRCHSDHHGAEAPLVTAASFALAGVPRRDDYRHQHVADFALGGRHDELACRECHEHADAVEAPRGGGRFLGLSSACSACHEDRHRGSFGPDCAACHGQQRPFADAPGFEHGALSLAGSHGRAGCETCHEPGSRHDLERERLAPPPARGCPVCHDSPHDPGFLARLDAASPAARPGGEMAPDRSQDACAACHRDDPERFAGAVMTAAQHAATGFSLAAPHRDVACEACHGQAPAPWAERFPGRAPGACRSCHDDVHQGQFDPQRYAQCTDCHHRTHFVPPAFSFPDHERSGFPLRGAHQAVGCAGCHDEVRDGVRRFDGAARECASCHDDVHRGAFDEHAPRRVDGRTGCARCHDESGFSGERTAFDHGWTGYPLQHAHQQVKCEQCHPRGSVPDQDGRHFRRRSRACAGCHDDPHLGQFAAAGPAGPQVDCARCHTERSFAQTRFDHDRDARFQLGASHRDVACDRCHRPVATAAGPVVRYRPLGRECGDCHVLGDAGEVRR